MARKQTKPITEAEYGRGVQQFLAHYVGRRLESKQYLPHVSADEKARAYEAHYAELAQELLTGIFDGGALGTENIWGAQRRPVEFIRPARRFDIIRQQLAALAPEQRHVVNG
jgi:hypothetical protein